jgi:catechol 2,3-dioxygenase-like lactoylglutathione lyase family enzyme
VLRSPQSSRPVVAEGGEARVDRLERADLHLPLALGQRGVEGDDAQRLRPPGRMHVGSEQSLGPRGAGDRSGGRDRMAARDEHAEAVHARRCGGDGAGEDREARIVQAQRPARQRVGDDLLQADDIRGVGEHAVGLLVEARQAAGDVPGQQVHRVGHAHEYPGDVHGRHRVPLHGSPRAGSLRGMRKLQAQGLHHITLVGADRQTSIDFWEGVLGMPFVFEQPNLDRPSESHLYFDPGDGRLITIFTNEERAPEPSRTSTDVGCVHHIAFALSQATFAQAVVRLDERGIEHSGVKDRGFMDSIYFTDPLGLLVELASYRFEPPAGHTHADVLLQAHRIRVARDDYNIDRVHLADAIEALVARSRESLSDDRSPKAAYGR